MSNERAFPGDRGFIAGLRTKERNYYLLLLLSLIWLMLVGVS